MSTFYKLHYHIIFGTRVKRAILNADIRPRLWSYMAGTVAGLGGVPRKIGGWTDHVHLLVDLKPSQNISDVVREVKKASTPWLRDAGEMANFSWQDGYSVFTVGHRELDVIHRYVDHQEEHHRIKSYQEELAELLVEAGVEFDPKYLP
jgi:putative transposase